GPTFAKFPCDLHARLYLPRDPPVIENDTAWATRLHTLASELGEWAQLRSMCARNGFAAGIAAEVMLEQLLPHVPDRPQVPAESFTPQASDSATPGALPESESSPAAPQQGALPELSDADLRAALRRASRAANDAVENAEK